MQYWSCGIGSGKICYDYSPREKYYFVKLVTISLLFAVDTPERIEFANVSPSSEQEESYSPMDEEEWTDRNFGASTAEIGSSDDDSSERYGFIQQI